MNMNMNQRKLSIKSITTNRIGTIENHHSAIYLGIARVVCHPYLHPVKVNQLGIGGNTVYHIIFYDMFKDSILYSLTT